VDPTADPVNNVPAQTVQSAVPKTRAPGLSATSPPPPSSKLLPAIPKDLEFRLQTPGGRWGNLGSRPGLMQGGEVDAGAGQVQEYLGPVSDEEIQRVLPAGSGPVSVYLTPGPTETFASAPRPSGGNPAPPRGLSDDGDRHVLSLEETDLDRANPGRCVAAQSALGLARKSETLNEPGIHPPETTRRAAWSPIDGDHVKGSSHEWWPFGGESKSSLEPPSRASSSRWWRKDTMATFQYWPSAWRCPI
jgi:hypothetical protein